MVPKPFACMDVDERVEATPTALKDPVFNDITGCGGQLIQIQKNGRINLLPEIL